MNDSDKIIALMIYYQHWGKDEIRARKTISDMHMTFKALENLRENKRETLRDRIMQRFHYRDREDLDLHFMWIEISELFLQDSYHLSIHNEDTANLINDMDYQDLLSVDAIIALV